MTGASGVWHLASTSKRNMHGAATSTSESIVYKTLSPQRRGIDARSSSRLLLLPFHPLLTKEELILGGSVRLCASVIDKLHNNYSSTYHRYVRHTFIKNKNDRYVRSRIWSKLIFCETYRNLVPGIYYCKSKLLNAKEWSTRHDLLAAGTYPFRTNIREGLISNAV